MRTLTGRSRSDRASSSSGWETLCFERWEPTRSEDVFAISGLDEDAKNLVVYPDAPQVLHTLQTRSGGRMQPTA